MKQKIRKPIKRGRKDKDGVRNIAFEFTGDCLDNAMRPFDMSNWNQLAIWKAEENGGSLQIPARSAFWFHDASLAIESQTIEKQPVIFLRAAAEMMHLAVAGEDNLLAGEYGKKTLESAFSQFSDTENPAEICAPAILPDDLARIRDYIAKLAKTDGKTGETGIQKAVQDMGESGVYLREFLEDFKITIAQSFLYNAPKAWRYLTALNLDLLFPVIRSIYGLDKAASDKTDFGKQISIIRRKIYDYLLRAVDAEPVVSDALGYVKTEDNPNNSLWQQEQVHNLSYAIKADWYRVRDKLRDTRDRKTKNAVKKYLAGYRSGITVAGDILLTAAKKGSNLRPKDPTDPLNYFFRVFDIIGGERVPFVPEDEKPDWKDFMEEWISYDQPRFLFTDVLKKEGSKDCEKLMKREYDLYNHLMKLLIQKGQEMATLASKSSRSTAEDPLNAVLIAPELFDEYMRERIGLSQIDLSTDGICYAENRVRENDDKFAHAEKLAIEKARGEVSYRDDYGNVNYRSLGGYKLVSIIEPCSHVCFPLAYECDISEYIYSIPSPVGAFSRDVLHDKKHMGAITSEDTRVRRVRRMWGFRLPEAVVLLINFDYPSYTGPATGLYIDKYLREMRRERAGEWTYDDRFDDWAESSELNLNSDPED